MRHIINGLKNLETSVRFRQGNRTMDKNIKEIIKHAKFVFISKESSREDLLEIIKSQLDFWDELEEYLTAQDDKNKTKQEICEGE